MKLVVKNKLSGILNGTVDHLRGVLRPLTSTIALVLLFTTPKISVAADEIKVFISGGANEADHGYSWTVSHDYDSPLVSIEFPHYRAAMFFAPDGWTTDCTFLVNVGVADKSGICKSTSESGLAGGSSVTFRMAVGRKGTSLGRGAVRVRFADGQMYSISDVEIPVPEAIGDTYVTLVGLAVIFALFVGIQRTRKGRPTPS